MHWRHFLFFLPVYTSVYTGLSSVPGRIKQLYSGYDTRSVFENYDLAIFTNIYCTYTLFYGPNRSSYTSNTRVPEKNVKKTWKYGIFV